MGIALADQIGNAMSVANQDTLHVSAAFVWDPVAWAVADVAAVAVAGAQGIAGARVMEEGATALVAALRGAAVSHLGVGAVSASHQQLMIVTAVMHLLMPPMDLIAAAGAKKLVVEHYLSVLLKMCVMKSSCWLVHCVMGSSKLPSNCLNWVKASSFMFVLRFSSLLICFLQSIIETATTVSLLDHHHHYSLNYVINASYFKCFGFELRFFRSFCGYFA